jgi:two-component system response regulator YesN
VIGRMKVLIVEDDILVLKFIAKNIAWESLGVDDLLQARNGMKALELIRSERPEIIILDIHLPKMNGLEVLKTIYDENIRPKVVILSGHDEFEYAQQAVKLGVEDYMLKPVLASDLEKKIAALMEAIHEEKEKIREVEGLRKQIQEQMPVMRSFYINNLLNGNIDNVEEVERKGRYLNLELAHKYKTVILCSIDVSAQQGNTALMEEENNIIRYSLSNTIRDILEREFKDEAGRSGYILHSSYEDQIVIILDNDSMDNIKKRRNRISRSILREVSYRKDYTVTLGFGNIYEETREIKYSYMEAKNAVKYKFVKGNNQIIDIKDVEPFNKIYFLLQPVKSNTVANIVAISIRIPFILLTPSFFYY